MSSAGWHSCARRSRTGTSPPKPRSLMDVLKTEARALRSSEDIVMVRQAVRAWAVELGFSLVDQTKVVTAASELARNTITYGGGGIVELERCENGGRRGLRLTFEDHGPGIA